MNAIRRRDLIVIAAIAIFCGVIASSPVFERLHGLSLDALTTLRWRVIGNKHDPATSHAVVIAFDEESYRTPPFRGTPTITWTREIGRILTAVVDGGAKVVGFDVIFPTSIEQSEIPFDNGTVGAHLRGFDREFLRSLALAARANKVVLGHIQHETDPIVPAPGQRIAVGQQRNIRALNVPSDSDNVVRRIPLTFLANGQPATLALELASRAVGATPVLNPDQSVTLAGYRIPFSVPHTMTVNFQGGTNDIPTYSLADLRACLEKGDTEFFRRNFQGKVVIFGTALDYEDRKMTTKRFATASGTGPMPTERCVLPLKPENPDAGDPLFRAAAMNGVYIHATAVNNLLRREAVVELGWLSAGVLAVIGAAIGAAATFLLAPAQATLALLVVSLVWTVIATVFFDRSVALPLFEPILAGFVAFVLTLAFRLVVTDKDKRFLRRTFALYLAPSVIERMVDSNKMPELGGEMRDVTVYFSDVAGFSSFSERMTPAELVALMNSYLSVMTDIIEAHGGFVDKYIGDAIVAIFGAPLETAHHANDAVRAALRCSEGLEEFNRRAPPGQPMLGQRIGLNSGPALVGNIGSRRRFNYTVMGDVVNLASRLEGANKYFGTKILATQTTVALTGDDFTWREIDGIRVKGRSQPVAIFEPLAEATKATPEQVVHAAAYSEGLARWRSRDFAGAAESFARVAEADKPSAMFVERVKEMLLDPPGADWEPVNTLEGK
jgi:class 3 adenylate cyclase